MSDRKLKSKEHPQDAAEQELRVRRIHRRDLNRVLGVPQTGSFILEQIEHAARLRGTHIVLEVAENNEWALKFYRKRNFVKLNAAIFLAKKLSLEDELLQPRKIALRKPE